MKVSSQLLWMTAAIQAEAEFVIGSADPLK